MTDLVNLLHRLDGHLGLAVYRGEGCQELWLEEAGAYITEIRLVLRVLEGRDD